MQTYDPESQSIIDNCDLRTLLRYATELRDRSLKNDPWTRGLAAKCGLDLDDPEGCEQRRAARIAELTRGADSIGMRVA